MNISQIRTYFPGTEQCLYFNSASYAIGNTAAVQAYHDLSKIWLDGEFNFTTYEKEADWCRSFFASLINANDHEVAICCFLSIASNTIAAQLPATATDNIVVPDIEFSSNFFPWMLLKDKGYDIRIIKTDEGRIVYNSFLDAIDKNTRLVAVSAVQSSSGFRADLALISAHCKKKAAMLFVDASQAMGVVPLDVKHLDIDFLASVSYKFLLGSRGLTYLYVKSEHIKMLKPIVAGWRSAEKPFESYYGPEMQLSDKAAKLDSSQSWFPVHSERQSFELIKKIGFDTILERNLYLRQYFYDKLQKTKIKALKLPIEARSNNIIFDIHNVEKLKKLMDIYNIKASFRQGKLRISFHFYNTEEDIDRLISVLLECS